MAKQIIGVYMIRNLVNGKRYYGSSQNCQGRLAGHRAALRRGDHTNSLLLNEWKLFGDTAFEFYVVVEVSDLHEARGVENNLIEKHLATNSQFGYNVMSRGRWSTEARLRNTEKKLIDGYGYMLLPNVTLYDQMSPIFVQTARKGHHDD